MHCYPFAMDRRRDVPPSLTRSLIILLLIAVCPVLAFGVSVALLMVEESENELGRQLQDHAHALQVAMDHELKAQIDEMLSLSADLSLDEAKTVDFSEKGMEALQVQRSWRGVLLVEPNSQQMVASVPVGGGNPYPASVDVNTVTRTRTALVAGMVSATGHGGGPRICLLAPVFRRGRIAYVLAIALDPKLVGSVLDELQLPRGWTGLVADSRGLVAGRSGDSSHDVGKPVPASWRSHEGREDGMLLTSSPEGLAAYTIFRRSDVTGWSAAIAVPVAEIEGPIHRIQAQLSIAGAVLIGLALISAAGMARGIVRKRDLYERALQENDDRLNMVLSETGTAIWEWNVPAGEFRFSPHWAVMRGAVQGEVVAKAMDLESDIHNEDIADVRKALNCHLGGASAMYESEHRVRHRDGHWIWVRQRGKAIARDVAGKPLRVAGIALDVTAHRQVEQALRQSEARYRALFDDNPLPIWVVDLQSLKFLDLNKRAIEHYGFTREEFSRLTLRDIRPEEDIPAMLRAVPTIRAEKFSSEWRHKKKDGSVIQVSIKTVPIRYGSIPAILAIIQDVTQLKNAEAMFRGIFDQSAFLAAILDQSGRVIDVNSTALCFSDASRQDVIGTYLPEMPWWHDDSDKSKLIDALKSASDGLFASFECVHPMSAQENANVMYSATPIFMDASTLISLVGIDITPLKSAEKALRESEARFRVMANSAPVLIWVADAELRRNWFNKIWLDFTGRDIDTESGDGWTKAIHPGDVAHCQDVYSAAREGRRGFKVEFRLRRGDGAYRWLLEQGVVRYDDQGLVHGYIGSAIDITERYLMEDQIRELAFYDPLTGLPNRRLIEDRLKQAQAASQRSGRYAALMFLDLDNFKLLNDEHGHAAGDELLAEVAQRICHCVRAVDTVGRLGGDEFVVVAGGLEQDLDASEIEARRIAEQIRTRLAEPYILANDPSAGDHAVITHYCSASIGVLLFLGVKQPTDEIFKGADRAMYKAKAAGRNAVLVEGMPAS